MAPAEATTPRPTPIVLIGASSGGVHALLDLVAKLPADLDAALLVVLHIDSFDSCLPQLMDRRGTLPTAYAEDGQRIEAGHIYVAPPDHHLLVEADVMRLVHGPKENYARPAIDPLFRSAALTRDGVVVGIILTGLLDDGAEGLRLVRVCGGIAMVQDPIEAEFPSMPRAALAVVPDAIRVRLDDLPASIVRSIGRAMPTTRSNVLQGAADEMAAFLGNEDPFKLLPKIADPSPYVCPDCGGGLWKLRSSAPTRFRCNTGHSFTLRTLEHAQAQVANQQMWSTIRALNEKKALLRDLAGQHGDDSDIARAAVDLASDVEDAVERLRVLLQAIPGSVTALEPSDEVP